MAVRAPWSDDEVEAFRDLARSFLTKEVDPNRDKHIAQGR